MTIHSTNNIINSPFLLGLFSFLIVVTYHHPAAFALTFSHSTSIRRGYTSSQCTSSRSDVSSSLLSLSSSSSSTEASKSEDIISNNNSNNNNNNWESIAESVFAGKDQRPVILFDGVCNLCSSAVNFALDYDDVGNFRFVSLQSEVGQSLLQRSGKAPSDISSIVLVGPDKSYFKSDAVLRIASELDGKNPLLPVMGKVGPWVVPRFMRDAIYKIVADNRYKFGETDQCRLEDDRFLDRFISDPK